MFDIQVLIGLKVDRFELSNDRYNLTLYGEQNGQLVIYDLIAYGDCCSETWIEGIYEESSLINHTINKVEYLELNSNGYNDIPFNGIAEAEDDDESYIQYYGLALFTEAGRFVIDFRNASNGYYGGAIFIEKKEQNEKF